MFNLPKCKECGYYEVAVDEAADFRAHACDSPKWRWTDDDKNEWTERDEPGTLEFAVKHNFPEFVISRHCAFKETV